MRRKDAQRDAAESAPRELEALVRRAETAGASDVHLRMLDGHAEISFRLDGVLAPVAPLPGGLAERVFGRVKFLAKLKTYQESMPQEGRIPAAALAARGDIRVATYPTITGEKIVLRLFSAAEVSTIEDLGFPPAARTELERFLAGTAGLLLLTGPAGSGKTTTIYAGLRHLAEHGHRHIITVEDPAEQVIPQVMQTEVNAAVGLDFAQAARHLLRQDPEVLAIGEIRDEETARIAIRAALTGHMVISTLHAGSCRGVFERLFDLCGDRSTAASAIEMALNQRLLRRLCPSCRGARCDECLGTGYRGRVPLVEWMRVDDALRAQLRGPGAISASPRVTLADAARTLVADGITDEAEVMRVLGP